MKSIGKQWMIAVAALALATTALADAVLYDFESGAQDWTSVGPITTDSGPLADGAVGQGRYHTGDFSLTGWGMVDVSPVVNLSAYTGLRVAARFHNVTGYPAFSGTPVLRIGLGIGDAEWLADVTLTGAYNVYSFNFADLVPDGTYATAPITTEQLADPALQIKLVMPKGSNTGVGQFDYDQVTALGPGGTSQVLPDEVIYDFYPVENNCYPDNWTFFGISQTDFGTDPAAEDGYGAFQAADWGLCDITYGEGTIGCTWAGCAVGVGPFPARPGMGCAAGGVDDANLDLSLGTGVTIRFRDDVNMQYGGLVGNRVQLQLVDIDGTTAVVPRSVTINPAVNRMPVLSGDWTTLTFYFKGLDSNWDNDDAVAGDVAGLNLSHITTMKLIWRRTTTLDAGVHVFRFDKVTLIGNTPVLWPDAESDGDIDLRDFAAFQTCAGAIPPVCAAMDANGDGIVDASDWLVWKDGMLGPDDITGPFYPWCY